MIKRTIAKLSNKARIKKLFKILNGQNEKFLHFFGISTPTVKDVDEQILEEKYRNFMQDIEKNGLIDYFLQNMNNNVENADVYYFCLKLCKYISDKSIVKKIIENNYFADIDTKKDLIKATEDPEYIKEKWLEEDVKKMHALGIYGDRAVERIKTVEEKVPGYIRKCLEEVYKMRELEVMCYRAVELIKTVEEKEPGYIKECLENVEKMRELGVTGDYATELIKTVGDPEYIKECLENAEKMKALEIYGANAVELIKTAGDPEYIKECLENAEKMKALGIKGDSAVELIKAVGDPEYIKECLGNVEKMKALGIKDDRVVDLIKAVGDPEYIKECLEEVYKMRELGVIYDRAVELIKTVEEKEPGYIKECLENVEKMRALYISDKKAEDLIETVGDLEYIKECIENEKKMRKLGIYTPNLIITVEKKEPGFIIEYIENKKKWKSDYFKINELKLKLETEYIKENLGVFLKAYGFEEKDISSKAEILEQMYEINDEVYQKLDFRLLDNKYLRLLGEDKINQISCYPYVQYGVLKLNEKKLKAWVKCIDTWLHNNDSEEWTIIANEILNNLSGGQYDDLIENIDNLDNADINKLIKVLQGKNVFEIKCEKDLENFELIKQQRCDKLIQSSEIKKKKNAVLMKLFGTDNSYAESLLRRYGQDIDSLPESEPKNFIKSIQMLVNCQSGEILEQIYNECEETVFIDKVGIEKALKKEYAKLYNEGLFKIENAVPIGENMYLAGTDFKMIVTAIGAHSEGRKQNNYKDDWNRPKINSRHICATYIRQDRICTAYIRDICYGFDCISEDSLVLLGHTDIDSSGDGMQSVSETSKEKYLTPDELIKQSHSYNEIDFLRIQNGKKKQPSYIVLIDGDRLENARKASKDWGGLPIVVIGSPKCLESKINKVKQMKAEYRNFPSPLEIDVERDKSNEQAVGKRELAENSNEVSGEDRRNCMAKIRTAIEKVKGDGEVER